MNKIKGFFFFLNAFFTKNQQKQLDIMDKKIYIVNKYIFQKLLTTI